MQLSKVLLPVDFSVRSDGAAHYAKTLACHFRSDLTIAHVFALHDPIISGPEAGVPAEWYDERREDSRRMLEEFHTDEFRNMPVRRMLLEGDPAGAIVDLAHTERTDLIVMPTRGYGRFRQFILGSVTAKVLHDADCPVLTGVHMEEAPPLAPISFRSIVCAVDFDSAGEKALSWAAQFATEFQARLTLVHALPRLDEGQSHYFDQALPMTLRKIGHERLDEIQRRLGTSAEIVLEPGRIAQVVHGASVSQKADLVVIGRHESPGLLGRLRANAYAIVRESPCPVVSV
ncbi:MAG: universal stress protein [Bryobacteraceae bacterium]